MKNIFDIFHVNADAGANADIQTDEG